MAIIGPDMNMEGRPLLATDFEIISVSEKSCHGSIQLMLNYEMIEKQFSCVSFFSISCIHKRV